MENKNGQNSTYLNAYMDCRNRCACYADPTTGVVEHLNKKVKTMTKIPVGGEYRIERDNTVTILTRINDKEFKVNSYLINT